jgi:transcriptional regulator with XRE-family HTH domain
LAVCLELLAVKITAETTDELVLQEIGRRLLGARLAKNLTQAQLAAEAGVSKRTIERLENGSVGTQLSGFVRVCRVLGVLARLDLFVPEAAPSPMAQLQSGGRVRRRASSLPAKSAAPSAKWEWGEHA